MKDELKKLALDEFEQITIHYEPTHKLAWCYMHASPRCCFSVELLQELNQWCEYLREGANRHGIKYHVIASSVPKVFNFGGDLELFSLLAQRNDRAGLLEYGNSCINALYANLVHFNQDITTISLVQGEALGGGFEVALSSDVLIAERGSRMGFPEILFNLFPGMGAYSLLSRRLGQKRAEQIILSGYLYGAEELHELGLVDILVEPGEGKDPVYDYISQEDRARNGFRGLRRVRDDIYHVSFGELYKTMEIWVDTALKLERRDFRMMDRLISRQYGKAT